MSSAMHSDDSEILLHGTVRGRETVREGVRLAIGLADGQVLEVVLARAPADGHQPEQGDGVGLRIRPWGLILGAPRIVEAGRRQLQGRIGLRLTNGDALRLVLDLDCGANAVIELPAAAGGDADTAIGAPAAVLIRPEDVTLLPPADPEQEPGA